MEFNATFLVSVISFIIFVFIMNTIFYKPVGKIISDRENLISDTLNEAQKNREICKKLIEERDKKLVDATIQSKEYLNQKIEKANLKSKEEIALAKQTSFEKIEKEKTNIETDKQNAEKELESHINNLADEIIKKVTKEC